jgi:hypothetical protein
VINDPHIVYPDKVIIDWPTGYAVNLPVYVQDYPGWWNDRPDIYARIKQLRKDMGISVVDFPNGKSQPDGTLVLLPMDRGVEPPS